MKSDLKFKFLNNLNKKKSEKGFTLIELLVVVIIIGVLAAIALPNLLSQVAKGRQSEAKSNLGAVNRAQQAYRLEEPQFGTLGDGTNGSIDIRVAGDFYAYSDDGSPDATGAAHFAVAASDYVNDILDYASGVYQGTDGTFSAVICESTAVDGTSTNVQANTDAGATNCITGDVVN